MSTPVYPCEHFMRKGAKGNNEGSIIICRRICAWVCPLLFDSRASVGGCARDKNEGAKRPEFVLYKYVCYTKKCIN